MENYKSIIARLEEDQQRTAEKSLKTVLDKIERLFEAVAEKEVPFNDIQEMTLNLNQLLERPKAGKLRGFYNRFVGFLVKKYGLVTPRYYTSQWMVLGMSIFGVPFGVIFGLALDNMAFLGIGLPMGMPIGMAIGAGKDKKAAGEGKVLNV
jgi:hypothetical protein